MAEIYSCAGLLQIVSLASHAARAFARASTDYSSIRAELQVLDQSISQLVAAFVKFPEESSDGRKSSANRQLIQMQPNATGSGKLAVNRERLENRSGLLMYHLIDTPRFDCKDRLTDLEVVQELLLYQCLPQVNRQMMLLDSLPYCLELTITIPRSLTLEANAQGSIESFRSQLMGVAKGLKRLHRGIGDLVQDPRGWHADVKPQNILVWDHCSDLELADLGLSSFSSINVDHAERLDCQLSDKPWRSAIGPLEPCAQYSWTGAHCFFSSPAAASPGSHYRLGEHAIISHVHGIGGVGKTTIARDFVTSFQRDERRESSFSINADDWETLVDYLFSEVEDECPYFMDSKAGTTNSVAYQQNLDFKTGYRPRVLAMGHLPVGEKGQPRSMSVNRANNRCQMARATPEVTPPVTVFADDGNVDWLRQTPDYILAAMGKDNMGSVVTFQRLRRAENVTSSQRIYNSFRALCLGRRNFDRAVTSDIDGGVPCLSGRTKLAVYRYEKGDLHGEGTFAEARDLSLTEGSERNRGDQGIGPQGGKPNLGREDDDDDDCVGFRRLSDPKYRRGTWQVDGRSFRGRTDVRKYQAGDVHPGQPRYGPPYRGLSDTTPGKVVVHSPSASIISIWREAIARTYGERTMSDPSPMAWKSAGKEGNGDNSIYMGARGGGNSILCAH